MSEIRTENYINISETQRDNLASELAKIILKLKEEESVECAYITCLKEEDIEDNNVIDLTIVRKSHDLCARWYNQLNSLHVQSIPDDLKKFGIRIRIGADDFGHRLIVRMVNKEYLSMRHLNSAERFRCIDLFNANILLDKTGQYTRLKQRIEEIATNENSLLYYHDNIAEVNPPIMDIINRIIEDTQNGADVNPEKEYNKFQNIKTPKK